MRSCQPIWTSSTPISASEIVREQKIERGSRNEKQDFGAFARHRADAGFNEHRLGAGQDRQDRRALRPVGALRRSRRAGLDAGGADGGRGFRPAGQGLEDRHHLRRSPEQARYRHHHCAAMVRRRQGRRHRRRPELGRCAGREQCHQGKERRLHQFGRGDLGPHQRAVLAQHRALDLRHLHAGAYHRVRRWSRPAATAGSS